jgi:autotransporter-associated beta strand protein
MGRAGGFKFLISLRFPGFWKRFFSDPSIPKPRRPPPLFPAFSGVLLSISGFLSCFAFVHANAPVRVLGTLFLDGTPTLNVSGFFPAAGIYPVVSYGFLDGLADFTLGAMPRGVTATLQANEENLSYDLNISAVNPLYWTGGVDGNWDLSTANWNFNAAPSAFQAQDIVVMDDSATGSTAIALGGPVSPSSVTVNNSTKNYSLSGAGGITGSAPLLKTGSGVLTLGNINTYTGGTIINEGSVVLGNGIDNGSVVGNIVNNASLVLYPGSEQNFGGLVSGTGSLIKLGAATFSLNTAPTHTGPTSINAGTLRVPSLAAASLVTNNGALVFNQTSTSQVNPAGGITGTGSVSYTGPVPAVSTAGQYLVDDLNSYTGGTTISTSRVNLNNASGLGSGPISVTPGGQVYATGGAMVLNNPITLEGIGWVESAGTLGAIRLNNGATIAGPVTLLSNSRIGAYSSNGIVSGAISGDFGLEILSQNNTQQTVTFSGSASNTYTGTTTVLSGVLAAAKTGGAVAIPGNLVIGNAGAGSVWMTSPSQYAGTGPLVFTGTSGNGRFHLMGGTFTFAGLSNTASANNTAVVQNSEPAWSPPNTGMGTLVLDVASGDDYSFTNGYLRNATGVVAVTKNGLGRQTFGGTLIDHTGPTTVNAGALRLLDLDDFHSGALAIGNGATVTFENSVRNFNRFTNTVITGNGTFVKSGPSQLTTGNSGGKAKWAMSGGLIDIQGGTFVNDYADQGSTWTSNKASMNIAAGATVATIGGNLIFIDALTGGGTLQNNNSWGVGVITLGRNNGSGTFDGLARDNGGPLAITKQGTGTQTFTGANTYSGPTRIEGGTLALGAAATLANTSSVTIASGAVFDVSATPGFTQTTGKTLTGGRTAGSGNDVVGSLTTGGTINVAGFGTPGTLTVSGDLSLSGGGNLQLDMSGTAASGNDKIVAGGALNLAGTTTVTPLFSGVPDTANPYKIATAASVTGDAAVNLTSGLTDSRYVITFDSSNNPGEVLMNVTGVGKTLVWSAASGQSWNTTDTALNWNGDADYFKNLDTVTFDETTDDTGGVTVSLTTAVTPAAITVTGNRDYTISGANGVIAGGGRLTKGGNGSGTAALTLATANSYSGGTILSQGTLTLTNAAGAGVGPIIIGDTNSGAENLTLNANVGSGNFANPITVTSEGSGTVTIAQNNALSTLSGTLTLNRPTTIVGGPDRTGISGKITGNVGTLTFTGNRTTLDNLMPNDFTGNVVIANAARLQHNNPDGIPSSAVVTINGTGQLHFNNGHPITLTALEGGVSGNNNVNIIAGAAATLTLGANNGSGVFNGDIRTALSVDKIGSGTQIFGGNNSYTGLTRILGGTLKLTSLTGLGGSTLVWDNLGGTLDTSELTTGTLVLGGLSGSQNLELTGLSLDLGANNVNNVYQGAITLTGADLGFTKRGSGDQTLGGAVSNSWSGPTTIVANGSGANANLYLAKTGGAVAIPANTVVNYGTGSGQANIRHLYDQQYGANVVMNFNNPSGQWTRFDLWGTHQTLAGVNSGNATTLGSGIIQNQGISNQGSIGLASITLNGSGEYLFNGYLRDTDGGPNASRQFALIKDGTGTQTLTGAQITFTGSVTVNGGKLNGTSFGANNNARTFTVNNTGTFELTAGNVFGGHNSVNAPTLVINNGGTVTNAAPATNNALNNVILNGGTLTSTTGSSSTLDRDYETYAAWGINGTVTSTGNSTITTTAASNGQVLLNSTGSSTTFNVTSGTLTVSTALIDGERGTVPSGYATALIKNGDGTMLLKGTNTYSGNTVVNAGSLELAAGAQLRFVIDATTGAANSISGSGTVALNGSFLIDTTLAGSLTEGTWTLEDVSSLTGAYGSSFSVVGFSDAGSDKWVKTAGSQVWTFDETTGVLTLTENLNSYESWINGFFPGETNPAIIGGNADPDNDGIPNAVEMVLGGNPATGMDVALLPTIELVNADPDNNTVFGDYLLFTYRRTDLSVAAGLTAVAETNTSLDGVWTAAPGVADTVILVDDNYTLFNPPAATDTDRVRVFVPRGTQSKFFGRLDVKAP